MANYVVSSGQTFSSSIGPTDSAMVLSGGRLDGSTITDGGSAFLLSGATAADVTVSCGGAVYLTSDLIVSSGTTTLGYLITAPTTISGVTIESGGLLYPTTATVLSGATLDLPAGAVMQSVIVSAGGTLSGPGVIGGPLANGQVYGNADGVTLGDYALNDYGLINIASGGVARGIIVAYGELEVDSGGSALATVDDFSMQVNHGGTESGAIVSSTPALGGGALFTYGVTSGDVIDSGGWENTLSGGSSYSETIENGGSATVNSGGILSGATVMGGADLSLYAGATAENLTLSSGASAYLSSGVTLSGAVVHSGGSLVGGGTGETIEGLVIVSSGGVESNLQFGSGSIDEVLNGARLSNVEIGSGAELKLTEMTVSSGQTFSVAQSAVFSGVDLTSGAIVEAANTEVASRGALIVGSGSVASSVFVLSGGVASALDGGLIESLTLEPGASAILRSGGELCNALVESGAAVSGSGALYSGTLTVSSGGVLSGGLLESGSIDNAYAGATETLSVGSGARVVLIDAVIGSGATFSAGVVGAAETLSGVSLASGAALWLASATVASGGTVDNTGEISSATIAVGGTVSGSGELLGTIVDSGKIIGDALIAGALTGAGTVEATGSGALTISSGGGFTGELVICAGSAVLAGAGGIGSGEIVFSAGTAAARLVIGAADTPAAGSTFSSEIVGFSSGEDSIDLAGIAFVSGASAVVSGSTLVLDDGGKTYDFKLGGAIASSYVVAQDGSGTLITADPPTGTDAARLVQAMATFGPLAESPATVTGSLLVSSWRPLFSEPAAHAPGLTRAL